MFRQVQEGLGMLLLTSISIYINAMRINKKLRIHKIKTNSVYLPFLTVTEVPL